MIQTRLEFDPKLRMVHLKKGFIAVEGKKYLRKRYYIEGRPLTPFFFLLRILIDQKTF